MFRRLESSIPKDFFFPADLKELGYRINEKDQIRSIEYPDQEFHYFISKNERCLEMQREAMNACIRREVLSRLHASSMTTTRLPIGASPDENHVPILTSNHLSSAKRVIVYVGETAQDLGVFAYRIIGANTVASGSAIDLVQQVHTNTRDHPAIIIANIGQLIWYRRGKQAMTQQTWYTVPRATAVSQPTRMDEVKNRIPMNEGPPEHVACVFEQVVARMTDAEAKIDIIGVGDGALEAVEYLQNDWKKWEARVDAIVVGASHVWQTDIKDEAFRAFWTRRGRAYLLSSEPVGTPLTGRTGFGCNCYSSGTSGYLECLMPQAYQHMLDYFKVVADNPGYENEPQDIAADGEADETDHQAMADKVLKDMYPDGTAGLTAVSVKV